MVRVLSARLAGRGLAQRHRSLVVRSRGSRPWAGDGAAWDLAHARPSLSPPPTSPARRSAGCCPWEARRTLAHRGCRSPTWRCRASARSGGARRGRNVSSTPTRLASKAGSTGSRHGAPASPADEAPPLAEGTFVPGSSLAEGTLVPGLPVPGPAGWGSRRRTFQQRKMRAGLPGARPCDGRVRRVTGRVLDRRERGRVERRCTTGLPAFGKGGCRGAPCSPAAARGSARPLASSAPQGAQGPPALPSGRPLGP